MRAHMRIRNFKVYLYFDTIEAYLSLERATFDYKGVKLVYMPSKMEQLMQLITNQHAVFLLAKHQVP